MKRHIHWNKEEPTGDEISSLKNFEEVLAGKPGSAPARWPYAVVAAAVVVGLVWIGIALQDNSGAPEGQVTDVVSIDSPEPIEDYIPQQLLKYEYEWEEFEINSDEQTTIITQQGSVISVPQNAFTRANSDSPVTVRFTDYYHPAKVFCSGIPMHYDSAGTTYHFQSAGMVAIQATQNGTPLALETGKELNISIPTFNTDDGFNTYALNDNGDWGYTGSSQSCDHEEMMAKHGLGLDDGNVGKDIGTGAAAGAGESQVVEYPEKPKLANKDNYRFHLDVDSSEFPELAAMEDVLFEATDPRFSYSFFQKTWDDVELIIRNSGYTVVLKSGKNEERFLVYPVLNESEFAAAMLEYEQRCKEVDSENARLQQESSAQQSFDSELERSRENARVGLVSASARVIGKMIAGMDESTMYRSFTMPSLGVVNCDAPLSFPVGKSYPVDFVYMDEDHKVPSPQVMLVEMIDRTYYSYVRADFDEFRMRPKKENVVFGASVDGSLVIGTQNSLRGLDHKILTEITLEQAPSEISTMDELEAWVDGVIENPDQEF